jgi:hypothetical protein
MLYSLAAAAFIWAMLAVLIEKLPIKSIPLFMYTLVISMAILGEGVKVSMIVFEQFGHENNNAVSESAKKALEV